MRVCSPAASRSSAFQRKVVRRRSSAPRRCSVSVPASGGSHGIVAVGHGATVGAPHRCTTVRARPAAAPRVLTATASEHASIGPRPRTRWPRCPPTRGPSAQATHPLSALEARSAAAAGGVLPVRASAGRARRAAHLFPCCSRRIPRPTRRTRHADRHPEQRRRDADPRLRRLPDPRRADRAGRHRRPRRRLPPHRHRRRLRQRGGRRPRHHEQRHPPRRAVRHHQAVGPGRPARTTPSARSRRRCSGSAWTTSTCT